MSPNHLEFDHAIQELREERPQADRRDRALEVVLRPRRMPLKLPGLAAAAAIVVALVLLLIPTRGSGLAWPEVLRRTQQATYMHTTDLNDKGHVIGESWQTGTMRAAWRKDESGRIVIEERKDHANSYLYLYRKELNGPNATQYATVFNLTPQMLESEKRFGGPIQTIDVLLNSRNTKLISQEKAEADGIAVQRYVLKLYGQELDTVDADPKSGRILYFHTKGGETDRFEYPEWIDPKIFSFESRLTRNVYLLDRRGHEDPKHEPPYMPKVTASKGGIQLRGASLGVDGSLNVYWTGYLPDNLTAKRLRVIGFKTGATLWLGHYKDGIHPIQGPMSKRLVCYRVALPEKIGNWVTLRIPTASSYVEFKDIPIARLKQVKE